MVWDLFGVMDSGAGDAIRSSAHFASSQPVFADSHFTLHVLRAAVSHHSKSSQISIQIGFTFGPGLKSCTAHCAYVVLWYMCDSCFSGCPCRLTKVLFDFWQFLCHSNFYDMEFLIPVTEFLIMTRAFWISITEFLIIGTSEFQIVRIALRIFDIFCSIFSLSQYVFAQGSVNKWIIIAKSMTTAIVKIKKNYIKNFKFQFKIHRLLALTRDGTGGAGSGRQ